jgi:hypothetical protein
MCCGDTSSLFLLITAEYASEQKVLIESIWLNLQLMDLETGE